ncbi:MAG: GTPase HflX [Candidatus Omnitrophica bacterium]|nr:GTPase HflX [Candidatus Omnitrophota bacterium]
MIETSKKEKALLVVAKTKEESWSRKMLSFEFKALVLSTGIEVKKIIDFNLNQPNASLYIGKGKASEIKEILESEYINVVIFNTNLNYSQQRNLEDIFQIKTLDRTQLILDIFAKHAKTKEGSLQVELAQLQYLLPRLRGKGLMLSRLGGGIGTLGPGETKLEVDRRKISEKITHIKQEIKQVSRHRDLARKKRQRQKIPICSLVGYTNAGKTTLFNLLTKNQQKISSNLFTTLDTVTRKIKIKEGMDVIISDTVGFIHKLPPNLIDAFKATLEELNYSDLLLHVVDASASNISQIRRSVDQVLAELNLNNKEKIIVFNKIDSLDQITLEKMEGSYPEIIFISASTGEGVDRLKKEIYHYLSKNFLELIVKVPISRMDLVSFLHKNSQLLKTNYDRKVVSCWVRISKTKLPFLKKESLEVVDIGDN